MLHRSSKSVIQYQTLTPLPDGKILGLPKLKEFADDKLNVTQNVKVGFHRIENIVGKEENAIYQHFLFFPQYFQRAFSSSASKVFILCKGLSVNVTESRLFRKGNEWSRNTWVQCT